MYTLRTIMPDKQVSNASLGTQYSTVFKDTSPEEFKRCIEANHHHPFDEKDLCGLVYSESGTCFPIHSDRRYYIVTESGKTFEGLN